MAQHPNTAPVTHPAATTGTPNPPPAVPPSPGQAATINRMNTNDSATTSSGSPRSTRRRSQHDEQPQRENQRRPKNAKNAKNNRKGKGRGNQQGQQGENTRTSNRNNRGNRSGAGRNNPKRTSTRRAKQGKQNRTHLEHSDLPLSVETSAGGLVLTGLAEAVRPNGSVDMSKIYAALIGRVDRRGRLLWSMPKGHVEEHESHRSTAEREVWEETGIAGTVIDELGTIDYWFVSEGTRIHKTVHHHLLRYVDGEFNDEDPEVTEVTWVPVNNLVERLAYADERRLARRALDTLPNHARAEAEAGRATPR
ncbi:NUDIX hydrolase [Corynebacterium urealyticum]|uniref:NUDIX hydrolase n=1 Tax=Corynebacterium urealyticum TaxID=43771 RepID=UPI00293E0A9C|nr:NUDIX domain-containing protein [Corynebacterium urealyticum]WOH94416.1 NUDIX domain-containing protein [Corynebacterium urealyticum]